MDPELELCLHRNMIIFDTSTSKSWIKQGQIISIRM